jgi:hypothetical protein
MSKRVADHACEQGHKLEDVMLVQHDIADDHFWSWHTKKITDKQ